MKNYLIESMEKSLQEQKEKEKWWKFWVKFFQYAIIISMVLTLATMYANFEKLSDFFYILFLISLGGFVISSFQNIEWSNCRLWSGDVEDMIKILKEKKE